jgi:fatty acid-binding protein DegV
MVKKKSAGILKSMVKGKIIINWVGGVIGSHTGPGTVALFFMGDERTE